MGPKFNSTKYHTLEGQWNEAGERFKWKFNTQNPLQSTISVWSQGKKHQIKDIQWTGTEDISPQKLSKLIRKSTDRFRLVFSPPDQPFTCHISLKKIALPEDQSSILTIQNVDDLAENLKKGSTDPLIHDLIKSMFEVFINTDSLQLKIQDLNEMLKIFVYLNAESQSRFIRKVIQAFSIAKICEIIKALSEKEEDSFRSSTTLPLLKEVVATFVERKMVDQEGIAGLIEIFEDLPAISKKHFLRKLLSLGWEVPHDSLKAVKRLETLSYRRSYLLSDLSNTATSQNSSLELRSEDIIELILFSFYKYLTENYVSRNVKAIIYYLSFIDLLLIISLNNNIIIKTNNIVDEKVIFIKLPEYLGFIKQSASMQDKQTKHQVEFLVRNILQNLKLMKSGDSKEYRNLRHAIYGLKFISKATAKDSLQVFDFLENAFKLASDLDDIASAFVQLAVFRKSYLSEQKESREEFANFVKTVLDESQNPTTEKLLKAHHNKFFIWGFVDLIASIIDNACKINDFQTHADALLILDKIEQNNQEVSETTESQATPLLFRATSSTYRQGIRQRIANIRNTLPSLQSLPEAELNSSFSSPSIFKSATERCTPWLEGMRLQKKVLEQDIQLKEEGPYLDLYGTKKTDGTKQEKLKEVLDRAFVDQKPILLLGEQGSGKTFFLKNYILDYLTHYHSTQPLPFYIPLNTLRNPQKNLIEEGLQLYGLEKYKTELLKRPTAWFLDGYDEVFIGNQKQHFNIYRSNNLSQWNQATFIYTCRPGTFTIGDEHYFSSERGKTEIIRIQPFSNEDVMAFFEHYVEKKSRSHTYSNEKEKIWQPQDYIEIIHRLKLTEIVKTPFYLRLLADLLPTLVGKAQTIDDIPITEEFLLENWICHLILRESSKASYKESFESLIAPIDYLRFALDVSRNMEICGKGNKFSFSKVSLSSQEDDFTHTSQALYREAQIRTKQILEREQEKLEQEHQQLLSKLKQENEQKEISKAEESYAKRKDEIAKKVGQCELNMTKAVDASQTLHRQLFDHEFASLRRPLLQKNSNGEVGFIHFLVYDYLRKVDKDPAATERLEKLLSTERNKEQTTLQEIHLKLPHPHFVGRKDLLIAIERRLTDATPLVLYGPPGIGKSETAIKFANDHLEDYGVIWTIDAATPEQQERSYKELAEALHLFVLKEDTLESVRQRVHRKLQQLTKKWLLIYDNLEQVVELPQRGGHILITARSRASFPLYKHVEITPLSPDDSVKLFQEVIKKEGATEEPISTFKELSDKLGCYPLLLERIANDIELTPGATASSYLSRLKERSLKDSLAQIQPDERYKALFKQTLDKTLAQLPPLTLNWLKISAHLNPDRIPTTFLKTWLAKKGEQDAEFIILRQLRDRGLIRFDERTHTFSIHRLYQNVLQDAESEQQARQLVRQLIEQIDLEHTIIDWTKTMKEAGQVVEHLTFLLHRQSTGLSDDFQAASWCWLGRYGILKSQYKRAQNDLEKALTLYEKMGENKQIDRAVCLNGVGTALNSLGNYPLALQKFEEALRIRKAALGETHPDVATSLNNIGKCLLNQGKHALALQKHEEALQIQKAALGETHPDVASSLNNIGNCLLDQGKPALALQNFEKALQIQKAALGETHPNVASSLGNIGSCLLDQGQPALALQKFEEALQIQKAALDETHPNIAASLNNIGNYYLYTQKQPALALEKYKEALQIQKAALGETHPNVAISLNNIGTCLYDQGQPAPALQKHEEALQIQKAALGETHPNIAISLNNIGTCLFAQGQPALALQKFEEAMQIYKKVLEDQHPAIIKCAANIKNCKDALLNPCAFSKWE